MKRPSHWIALSMLIGGFAYLGYRSVTVAAKVVEGPVIVRRGEVVPVPSASMPVTGTVSDPLGWPVVDARVRLVTGGDEVAVDSDGAFTLRGAADAGGHLVVVTAPGYDARIATLRPGEPAGITLRESLPWEAASPRAAEPPPPILVRGEGFLRDRAGEPVANASVVVVESGARQITDDTGRYTVPLPTGRATIAAWDAEGRAAWSEAIDTTGERGLMPLPALTVMPAGTVQGYLKGADGDPASGVRMVLRGNGIERAVHTDGAGAFRFAGVIDGDYVVTADPHHGALGSAHELGVAGGVVDLELSLSAAEALVVRVTDGAAALAGVWVVAGSELGDRALARTDADGEARLVGLSAAPRTFEVREPVRYAPFEVVDYDDERHELRVAPQ